MVAWQGQSIHLHYEGDDREAMEALRRRQAIRDAKLAQLILYKLLCHRNWARARPECAVSLPTRLFSQSGPGEITATRTPDGCRACIRSESALRSFDVLVILHSIGLSKENGRRLVRRLLPEYREGAMRIVEVVCSDPGETAAEALALE
jgi:hypothetical protein